MDGVKVKLLEELVKKMLDCQQFLIKILTLHCRSQKRRFSCEQICSTETESHLFEGKSRLFAKSISSFFFFFFMAGVSAGVLGAEDVMD